MSQVDVLVRIFDFVKDKDKTLLLAVKRSRKMKWMIVKKKTGIEQ